MAKTNTGGKTEEYESKLLRLFFFLDSYEKIMLLFYY